MPTSMPGSMRTKATMDMVANSSRVVLLHSQGSKRTVLLLSVHQLTFYECSVR